MTNSYSSDIMNYFLNNEDVSSTVMVFENNNEELNKLNNTIKSLSRHEVEIKVVGFTLGQLQIKFISTDETKRHLNIINKLNEIPLTPLYHQQWKD